MYLEVEGHLDIYVETITHTLLVGQRGVAASVLGLQDISKMYRHCDVNMRDIHITKD